MGPVQKNQSNSTVELARNIGLSSQRIKEAERLVETRQKEIIDAWNNHFGG
jgi:hypothetical protein